MYRNTKLFIDGVWRDGGEPAITVVNPATEERIGEVACASRRDLDDALAAVEKGFAVWRAKSALERSRLMRKAAELLRERGDHIARLMTTEEGKPIAQSRVEIAGSADTIDWFAEEGRRAYGRIIPSRASNINQCMVKEPVGPIAAFTPWNFPVSQAVRKVAAALAAGCSVILKGPEEAPASCAALIEAFADAGLPAGVLNLVFGVPSDISEYLIPHPIIKKVSFTGSTVVGMKLASLAGQHMKRVTMELGGHAPAIVCDDADIENAVAMLSAAKFRNAGQVCTSPTRFLIHDSVYDQFLDKFVTGAKNMKVGNGLDDGIDMGPLANRRRLEAMEVFTADAVSHGAKVVTGGSRIGNQGYFFQPTVLTDVSVGARMMNEEPFGPMAAVGRFSDYETVVTEANRLAYGLAAYVYTKSAKTISDLGRDIESGMISVNHNGLGLPELPGGGIKDSGYGSEGGIEGMDAYVNTKLITQLV